ncbi:MAG: hypothetical protein ACI8ZM_002711 [Crocinitomix sp.]|jgi:hypothetical protein
MILKRFYSNNIIRFQPKVLTTKIPLEVEESISVAARDSELLIGEYDVLNGSVYCVFSYKNLNYLFLKDSVIEITDSINIKYRVNYTEKEVSYIEIFKDEISLIREEYFNEHEPLINPFDGEDDWEYVNFAFHVAGYIDKAKEAPNTPLFHNHKN